MLEWLMCAAQRRSSGVVAACRRGTEALVDTVGAGPVGGDPHRRRRCGCPRVGGVAGGESNVWFELICVQGGPVETMLASLKLTELFEIIGVC
jgi:hypothetical protein